LKKRDKRSSKIEEQITSFDFRNNKNIAWPLMPVYDKNEDWCGFAMYAAKGIPLQYIFMPNTRKRFFSWWNLSNLLNTAYSLIDTIAVLHNQNIIIGDLTPRNIMVDPETCKVSIIDCDSVQFESRSGINTCPVATPLFQPPEILIKGDFSSIERTPENELFSVAVVLFHILMFGCHPYSRINGSFIQENIKKGAFAWNNGESKNAPKGIWKNLWKELPNEIRNAFIETFKYGHSDVSKRTTLNQWSEILGRHTT
jgi:DNA-binding helix-hairpin-helix protein with protein kinase domain